MAELNLTPEIRGIILVALDMLIEQLRDERRENTFSEIREKRLAAAVEARLLIGDGK